MEYLGCGPVATKVFLHQQPAHAGTCTGTDRYICSLVSLEHLEIPCSVTGTGVPVLYHGYIMTTPLYHRHQDQRSWNSLAPRALSVY
jgi:hypothetical protein